MGHRKGQDDGMRARRLVAVGLVAIGALAAEAALFLGDGRGFGHGALLSRGPRPKDNDGARRMLQDAVQRSQRNMCG